MIPTREVEKVWTINKSQLVYSLVIGTQVNTCDEIQVYPGSKKTKNLAFSLAIILKNPCGYFLPRPAVSCECPTAPSPSPINERENEFLRDPGSIILEVLVTHFDECPQHVV